MSELKKISRNSIFSFLSTFFRLFANVILFWLIARYYGKEIFGQFTIAQTFASFFVLFADFGLDVLLTTELPRNLNNSNNFFNKLFSIKLILSFLSFCGMIIVSFISNFSTQVRDLLIIFSFYAVLTTLTNFLFALFRGNEKFEYEAKVSFLTNFGALFVVCIFMLIKEDIIIISIVFAFIRLMGLLVTLSYAFHIQPNISFKLNFNSSSVVIKKVLIFGLFLIFGNLYFQLDTILLSFWKGEESVGVYQSVFRLILLPLFIPDILVNSLMPTQSRLNSENFEKWKTVGFLLNKFLIIISIPLSISIFFSSEQLIHLIYGKKEYAQAIPILKIFSMIIFVRFISETHGLMLTTSNRQKKRMLVVLFATIINFVINWFVIPKFGINGAAITSLITNTFVSVLFIYLTKHETGSWNKIFINPTLIIVVILISASFWIINILGVWYLGVIPFTLYFIIAFKKLLTENEKKYFSELKFIKNY
ncbi:MAG: flippase [Ignavibacteriales bacterium]|nr:flippase [Ignavibacteriales bacterium]